MLCYAVADPQSATGALPVKKSKKFKVLAIFEGFWPITMSLCVANYLYRPSQLYKVNMSSKKSGICIRTPLWIFCDTSK